MENYRGLKELRKEKKMTQIEFAESIGIEHLRYAYYELGYADIPSEIVKKICEVFHVSADEILGIEQKNIL